MSAKRTSGAAITSLICGILGFFSFGVTGLLGVIFGHVALARIKRSAGLLDGKGLAIGGLVTGYISFIGILGAGIMVAVLSGGIFAMKGIAESARHQQVEADFRNLESALMTYKLQAGTYPTAEQGLAALIEKPVTEPEPKRWSRIMNKMPVDPWHNPYGYRFPDPESGPEIFSKGPDGVEGTKDDLSRAAP